MKKIEVVKSKIDFNNIIKSAPFLKNRSFVLYIRNKKEKSKLFGIAVSKKLGNAVMRNKLKRRVRVIVDNLKESFPNNGDYIIMIKKRCVDLSFQDMKSDLESLIKEIK